MAQTWKEGNPTDAPIDLGNFFEVSKDGENRPSSEFGQIPMEVEDDRVFEALRRQTDFQGGLRLLRDVDVSPEALRHDDEGDALQDV